MTIKALVFGGVQIGNMRLKTATLYDGVWVELIGTTRTGEKYQQAGCTIEMNPAEAIDLAGELLRAAAAHGEQTRRQVAAVSHRLSKKLKA